MREDMDSMLNQVRSFVQQTDAALKEAQRLGRDTAGLMEVRDDMWALEDRVRAAKWADTGAQQAELANQIDPLMLQVMAKCQQHKDQVRACQPLLNNIASWCERGTRAYTFVVHEPGVNGKAPARYSSSGASDNNTAQGKQPASRIPAYKSPTKQARGQVQKQSPQKQQQQAAAQGPAQQQDTGKVQSRIPQPRLARKSLPDADQQGSTPDQTDRDCNGTATPATDARAAPASAAAAGSADARAGAGKVSGGIASRIAAFQRAPAAVPAAPAAPSAVAAARAPASTAAPAAAAAAAGPVGVKKASPAAAPAAAAPAPASAAATAGPEGHFVPLDLDDADSELLTPEPQQQAQAQAKAEQQQQEQKATEVRASERTSHSSSGSGSINGSSFAGSRGSGSRVTRSLLQLEPSRDDVPLSSAGQLMQQAATQTQASDADTPAAAAGATAANADTAAAPAAAVATPQPAAAQSAAVSSVSTGSPAGPRLGGTPQGDALSKALHLKLPRTGYAADPTPTEPASNAAANNEFAEFGPLRSFTPLVSQQVGRSHPFAPGSSSSGLGGDRGSLRTSQDISMLLRSGMLMEAALLSSNASRMHVIHDAVSKKPAKAEGEPEVPVVPARLAVHKRRPWWAQAARVVVGTAAMAVAGAAGAVAAKNHKGEGGRQHRRGQQPLALEEASKHLPYVPLGPAPDASAGCG